MPAKPKPAAAPRHRETSPIDTLSEWVRQGTESFFAMQKILLDLVTRQNANTIAAVRDRLASVSSVPAAALTEMAGEGISNFIAAQRVMLQLAQRQNDIIAGAVEERVRGAAPVEAAAGLLRRGIDTFLDMQQHFLTIFSRQADTWIDSAREGRPFDGKGMAEMARDAMETFVRSQKKFLDVVAEQTARATGEKNGHAEPLKRQELADLAREAAEAFIEAQKKLLDIASQQIAVQIDTGRRTARALNPFPPVTLTDLTRHTVDSFVAAQKALLDVVARPARAIRAEVEQQKAAPRRRKPVARKRPKKAAATAASA